MAGAHLGTSQGPAPSAVTAIPPRTARPRLLSLTFVVTPSDGLVVSLVSSSPRHTSQVAHVTQRLLDEAASALERALSR